MVTSLLDPIWGDISVHARGSAYQSEFDAQGFPIASRNLTQITRSVRLSETVAEAARRAEFSFDNSENNPFVPGPLYPVTIGTDIHLYGHVIDTATGGPSVPKRLFYGRAYSDGRDDDADVSVRTYTCYGLATVLARNEDWAVYRGMSTTQILRDVSSRFGVPLGTVVDTVVETGQIIMGPGMNLWGLLQESLRRTYKKTGRRYFIRESNDGLFALDLLELGQTGVVWTVTDGDGGQLVSVHVEESAEDLRTKAVVVTEEYDEEGTLSRIVVLAERELPPGNNYRDTFGLMTRVVPPENTITLPEDVDPGSEEAHALFVAEANKQLDAEFADMTRTRKTMSTTAIMIPGIRRGDRVRVRSFRTGISSEWYVDSVVNDFTPGNFMQQLDLVYHVADVG